MSAHPTESLLIIDYGSQVTQLIARRIREAGVYSEIVPPTITAREVTERGARGLVLSGGPASVTDQAAPGCDSGIFALGIPILGICYGEQLMAQCLGGSVIAGDHREYGRAYIDIIEECRLTEGLWNKGERHQVWMSHGDKVESIPAGFRPIARSEISPFAVIADEERKFYGVQFHPEVAHTPDGAKLLANFALKIAGCRGDWNMAAFKQIAIEKVRSQVGTKRVLCAVSGGVDSSVVAALLHEAIGEQLICVFVDTGMLRLNERAQVEELFRGHFNIPLVSVDASERFLELLAGIDDPESKRKIIGKTFIDVFEDEVAKLGTAGLGGADFLAQGTLYPDVIESLSIHGGVTTIKSHHNVGGLPERMKMALIEPVRELFKDEVRALGIELGMPEAMVWRHPFPGPGLAIRIPGEITREKLDILRAADQIYLDEIRRAGLYRTIWQAFAVLLPVKTVGVMGDARTYEHVLALRAVTSSDGMTADYYPFDHAFLGAVAGRIINEVKGVNRVVYDITSKPPGTIEWE